jgi:hypothetical protein
MADRVPAEPGNQSYGFPATSSRQLIRGLLFPLRLTVVVGDASQDLQATRQSTAKVSFSGYQCRFPPDNSRLIVLL